MSEYISKLEVVEANQFFYGKPMIPGVVYPADRSEGSPNKYAYIFIDDNDSKKILTPGDWVLMLDDEEGNIQFCVLDPLTFDLIFVKKDSEFERVF